MRFKQQHILRTTLGLLGALTLLTTTPTAGHAANGWYWTESYAEHQVIARIKLPCQSVYTPANCNPKTQQKNMAEFTKRKEACLAGNPYQLQGCINSLAALGMSFVYARAIRNGLPIGSAHCIGTGTPDSSTYRFTRFRCTIVVDDAPATQNPIAHGRITVTPTGKTTLRWQII